MTDSLPKLLTPPEVQRELRISRATFYRWLKAKKLSAVYIHGLWRVPRTEIDRVKLICTDAHSARK